MSILKLLSGKEKIMELNKHKVKVLVPTRSISYEEGTKEAQKIIKKIKVKKRKH